MKHFAKVTDGWGNVQYFPLLPDKTELESLLNFLLTPRYEQDEMLSLTVSIEEEK